MRTIKNLFLILFMILLTGVETQGGEPLPSLSSLQEKYDQLYTCPGSRGFATFSVKISNVQLQTIAKALDLPEPFLKFHFLNPDKFFVEMSRLPQGNGKEEALKEFSGAIQQSVESFFQSYFMIGFKNVLKESQASPTISLHESGLKIEGSDVKPPAQTLSFIFDGDFRLQLFESRDLGSGDRSAMVPTWEKREGKYFLVGLETRYFQGTAPTPNFISRWKIENLAMGNFFMPGHVTLQAEESDSSKTFFDFHLGPYEFAEANPPRQEGK